MVTNPLQRKAYDAVAASLPFAIDPGNITVEPGLSYTRSPIKAHDYAAGVMGALASVVERLGRQRGLSGQKMTLNRRRCGLLLNSAQMHFLNGYGVLMDTWPIGPDNGTYEAKDGRHVTIIGLFPHLRDALLEYFQCSNSARSLQSAFEKKPAQQIEDELAALNLPVSIVRSPEEWLNHPQGAQSAKRPMIDIEPKGGAQSRKLGRARHRPLEGLRVVEVAHLVAGPTISRLLAEQGAEVISIQAPLGDWVLPLWLDVNWGKKSILLDLKSRFGKKRFVDLLGSADVLVSSLRPGALDRIGLGETTMRELNPNLVLANVSYPVKTGPWKDRRGFEQIAQAVSGMMHVNSQGLTEPTLISVLINDYLTGYLGAIGVIAALAEREEKGGYWEVNASLTKCAMIGATLTEPIDAEQYAPVGLADLIEHGLDQETPWGTFTRLKSAVEYSDTPEMPLLPPGLPGIDPDSTRWAGPSDDGLGMILHRPSRLAREGLIRNLIPGHGIEDRGDGGGLFSLASKKLLEIVIAQRAGAEQ
jgi:crotonobetainyl-CoA:carnitine CoA-transferase CaiB-like acyl-CoA transferase